MKFRKQIKKELEKVLEKLGLEDQEVQLEHPAQPEHGDYSANIAMAMFANLKFKISNLKLSSPLELAKLIAKKWEEIGLPDFVQKIEVAPPGFLNIWLKIDYLSKQLEEVLKAKNDFGMSNILAGKKIMVEYAHPNTHKELHVGHMRTLITGEALARIFEAAGAEVFRANYQGDIGPHVAKSIWGTEKILKERKISWEEAEKMTLAEKAHLLGEGYVKGVAEYSENKEEIDRLNQKLYQKDPEVLPVYERTRRWSLEYYDMFYNRFYTKFDRLFFESEVADLGKKIVMANVGRIFQKSEGAVIFDGEKYGLHKRVFITDDGNPTYEAKEMGLAYEQYNAFPFDLNIHVVGADQTEYFKVVIKALELLDPKFEGKEFHLPMGMVNLVGKKMSSRTGEILRVDDLLDEVKNLLRPMITKEGISAGEKEKIAEVLTIASVKYSILRVGPKMEVAFDPKKSVNLEGDSGPYLEYTYARTQSVVRKFQISNSKFQKNSKFQIPNSQKIFNLNKEEVALLRTIYKFPEIVQEAAQKYAPNLICNFLYDLCQKFNLFYDKHRIIHNSLFIIKSGDRTKKALNKNGPSEEQSAFRLLLTVAVGQIIKNGLDLLGIKALERM